MACSCRSDDGSCLDQSEISSSYTQQSDTKITCIETVPDEGPIGKITRNQDFDIIGGKMVHTCLCGARNGLDQVCRRVSCQGNNPGCKMNPPRCWPKYKPPKPTKSIEKTCSICLCFDKN